MAEFLSYHINLEIADNLSPEIIETKPSFLVVFKPHNLHTAPLKEGEQGTLLSWCVERFPETALVRGKKAVEGGLLHRLDYETAGIVLVARTDAAWTALWRAQGEGRFIKEYYAVTRPISAPRFTAPPFIESGFRAFGPGRKRVLPITDSSRAYRTQILSTEEKGADTIFRVSLDKGFRHQVRAHLAWAGCPINNDTLYGGFQSGGPLALIADKISFPVIS